jgi:DNA helicase-2/ATP-dependent DNA helicase PcrA
MKQLEGLNPVQYEAVTAPLGNSLVLAGAGSGKTRVLVQRIAWLMNQQYADSYSVLAVTFTNKAANEMRQRLAESVQTPVQRMWVGTFHGLAHRLLRLHWRECGLSETFQVMDSDDQLQLIKRIFKSLQLNEDRWEPRQAQNFISRKKEEGIRATQLNKPISAYDRAMYDVYIQYEATCREQQLVDFSELLLCAFEFLNSNLEYLTHYQNRFSHILVDEFQDTNTIQYRWLSLLAKNAQSVMVVGDDDQSIYGWRGAKVENITRFIEEYQNVQVIRLEQNYRSTGTILAAANAVIANNDERIGKTLWTQGEDGEKIILYGAFNEEDEAIYVVRKIRAFLTAGGDPHQIGILYRSNAQSRILEEALMRSGIPYVVYGGLRFFERAEIKDTLAYLRLLVNLEDNVAFERMVNTPPRGVGEKTVERIRELSQTLACSYWEAVKHAITTSVITGRGRQGLIHLIEFMDRLEEERKNSGLLSSLIQKIIHEGGILEFWKEQKGEQAQNRIENLEELCRAAQDFESNYQEENELSPILAFLAYASLESGEKKSDPTTQNAVQMMTLHAAKGLEFPQVFLCGLEEGLFPHHFSLDNLASLQEERRLCYVGITRAMQHLCVTYAERRRLFGQEEARKPSRFLAEIPEKLVKEETVRMLKKPVSYVAPTRTPNKTGEVTIGQRVIHPKFGQGIVLDYEQLQDRARAHIHFDVYGSKWLTVPPAILESA